MASGRLDALLVQEPGRVEGPGRRRLLGRVCGADRSVSLRTSRPQARGTVAALAVGSGDDGGPERAHRQGLGEVVALQHGGGIQPGRAARPALDVGRREQRLAHRLDRADQHLLRQRPVVRFRLRRSADRPPAPPPARTPPVP